MNKVTVSFIHIYSEDVETLMSSISNMWLWHNFWNCMVIK